jgi:hypothetical protein
MNVLRGQIYEAMDNRTLAMECFKEALRQDVYCYEAFDLLVNHHMLSSQEGMMMVELCKLSNLGRHLSAVSTLSLVHFEFKFSQSWTGF